MLRVLAVIFTALGSVGAYMTQVGPDDAVSNFSKWWTRFGPPPEWVKNPTIDEYGFVVFAIIAVLGTVGIILSLRNPDWYRKVVFGPVKLDMAKRCAHLALPIKTTSSVKVPVRVVMELHKLDGTRIAPEFVLASEVSISRQDGRVGRVNIDRRFKNFMLFDYYPAEGNFRILGEGGSEYTIPADNYRATVEVVGDKMQKTRSFTIIKSDRDLHFSDGTDRGSFDLQVR